MVTEIDEVFVALPVRSHYDTMLWVTQLCEAQGVTVHLRADMFTLGIAMSNVQQVADQPFLSVVSSGPMGGLPYVAKRCMDRVLGVGLLLAFAMQLTS